MTGLTWRPLTKADAQSSADLLNDIEAVDRIGEYYTAEDTLQELIDPYADLERASLAAFDGDRMVGYMKVRYKLFADEVDRVFLDGGVHPAHRRRGIGATLVKAGIEAARTVHAAHHPELTLFVDVHKAEHIEGVPELVRSQGFAPVRYFQRMEHPLGGAVAPMPGGFHVERWSAENADEFRLVRNESFADHWNAPPLPADAWQHKFASHALRPELSFLLRDKETGVPASLVLILSWAADTEVTGVRDAHFMVIGTIPGYRKRGLASAGIAHALRTAAEHGYDQASLIVDSASEAGAPGVFERAGFTPKMRYVRWALEA
ncbi:GNAT family N-acetyltransferase [Amycolatopsis sp. NPDC004079]|uniref:GNAT family N-acetyltransferase n=1 Tax=Amycolatopsis sp. NPDC004079 TaxID=3154549 RepID=UPI0033A451A6